MRKRELASAIAQELDLPPGDVARVLDALFDRMADTLLEDGRLEVTGFGLFAVHSLAARRTYVPSRKETIVIPARRAVRFREARELRERLNPPAPVDAS